MRAEDTGAMRKILGQKRKDWGSTSISKKVKFVDLRPMEAPIELDALKVIEAFRRLGLMLPYHRLHLPY